jgi:hypothetical protein
MGLALVNALKQVKTALLFELDVKDDQVDPLILKAVLCPRAVICQGDLISFTH